MCCGRVGEDMKGKLGCYYHCLTQWRIWNITEVDVIENEDVSILKVE